MPHDTSFRTAWATSGRPRPGTTASPGKTAAPGETAEDEALNRIRSTAQAVFETTSDLLFLVRKDGTINEFHAPKGCEFNFSPDALLGKRFNEIFPAELGRQALYYLEKALRVPGRHAFPCQHHLGGKMRDFEVRMMASAPDEVLVVLHDVTSNKLTEKEILEITSREQMRIGQDLHDGLGQHLTGITFLSRALENKLTAKSVPEAAEAAEIGKLVIQALAHTRNLARGLCPLELDRQGLAAALKELAATTEKLFKIKCLLEVPDGLVIQDENTANHLFRLTQEAISNSVKHGNAKQVEIRIRLGKGKLTLSVADNGIGMADTESNGKGLGLRIMNFRAQKLGGTLQIAHGELGGTTVTCSIPEDRLSPETTPTH